MQTLCFYQCVSTAVCLLSRTWRLIIGVLVAAGVVTVTVTGAPQGPSLLRDTAFTTLPPPAVAACSKFAGEVAVAAAAVVTVVGTVAVAVTVPGVEAVGLAVEALLVQVSLWLEHWSTPNAAPARPEQVLY